MKRNTQIDLFFKGKLDTSQAAELLSWIHSEQGKAHLETEMDKTWEELEEDYVEFEAITQIELWEKIRAEAVQTQTRKSHNPRQYSWWMGAAAACVLLVAAIGIFTLLNWDSTHPDNLQESQWEWIVRQNPPGQKTKVQLPDGSVVYLNADSEVRYRENFLSDRAIHLEGEAFFEVVADPLHPFVVESNGVYTQVVGTSFNINTYSDEKEVTVTVLTGRVMMGTGKLREGIFLDAGEEAVASGGSKDFSKQRVDVSKAMLWTSGILYFENTPFESVIVKLSRWYGVEFNIRGPIPDALSSGTFQRHESLENVLYVLGPTLGFTHEINGKTVTITFK